MPAAGDARCAGPGGGVQADGGGGGQVQALGPAVDRHGHRLVGQREQLGGQAPGLVAEQPGGRRRPVRPPAASRSSSGAGAAVGGQHPQPGGAQRARPRSASGAPVTTGRWNRLPAEARTHLLLYGSTEAAGEDHAVGPGRVGGAQHRAGVARVADVGQDDRDQPRAGVGQLGQRDVDEPADRQQALRRDGLRQLGHHLAADRVHGDALPGRLRRPGRRAGPAPGR